MAGFLAEFTKIADKSEWVQVHFCMICMDGQLTKRIKTYSKKGIAQREITKWLKRSTNNFVGRMSMELTSGLPTVLAKRKQRYE